MFLNYFKDNEKISEMLHEFGFCGGQELVTG